MARLVQKEVQRMHNYEVMFVVRPNLEDEATNVVCENMKKVLESKGATINEVVNMGRRELAYEMQRYIYIRSRTTRQKMTAYGCIHHLLCCILAICD